MCNRWDISSPYTRRKVGEVKGKVISALPSFICLFTSMANRVANKEVSERLITVIYKYQSEFIVS